MVTQNQTQNNNNQGNGPDKAEPFVLCGHINLHKSDSCQAQFVDYMNRSLGWLDFDGKNFTNDTGYAHKRGNRPVNVHQWHQRQANGTLGGSDSESGSDADVAGPAQGGGTNNTGTPQGAGPHLNQGLGNNTQFQGNLQNFLNQMRKAPPPPTHPKDNNANLAKGFIFAIQEPHVAFGKLTGISNSVNILSDSKDERIRAALVISKNMNVWPVKQYTTPDM